MSPGVVPASPGASPAAHERHDLDFVAIAKCESFVLGAWHDAAVHFHRHAATGRRLSAEHFGHGDLLLRELALLAVDSHSHHPEA